jgi:hypothetical protein
MAFKYYPALKATDGDQTLPRPMVLHNPNSADITIELTPEGQGLLFQPFGAAADVLSSIVTMPKLKQAKTITSYDATTIDGDGSGASINVTVTDVKEFKDSFPTATGAIFSGTLPIGEGVATYSPTTNGNGVGFKVKFSISGTVLSQVVSNVEIINRGYGYAANNTLTFTHAGGTFTYTVRSADLQSLFQPSAAAINAVGDNYRGQDLIEITITETVDDVDYTYPVRFRVAEADLASTKVNYVIGVGVTTPVRASKFKVLGTTDRAVTAIG